MDRITEYTFVASAGTASLAKQINEQVQEGWQPYGTPFLLPGTGIVQPMVKYEAGPPPAPHGSRSIDF